jgi:hypothetical protein
MAVFASDLFKEPRFQDVSASHAKEEVTRTVVEHCCGKIRSMLDSIEVLKTPTSSVAFHDTAGGHDPDLDDLAQELRRAGVSNDPADLAGMSSKLKKGGIMALVELQSMSKEEIKEQVAELNLKPAQFNKLVKAASPTCSNICAII